MKAPGQALEANGSDMTEPEKEDPLGRADELESIVDDLDEKVADEREAKGVPGKPSERENTATRVSENEPPD
jgi:ribosome-binding protein aMBF1 (putative translation factor)